MRQLTPRESCPIRIEPIVVVRLLAWPLRLGSLLVLALLAVTMAIALSVPIAGIPLFLILLSWFWKYSIALLEHAMSGAPEPPPLAIEMLLPFSGWRSFVILLILILVLFITGGVSWLAGPIVATLLAALFASLLPAMLGLLAATGNIRLALDPPTWLNLVRQLGSDYAVILLCMLTLALLDVLVAVPVFSKQLPTLVGLFVFMYTWLAFQSVIGGVLYLRRKDSGIEDLLTPVRVLKEDPHLQTRRNHFVDRVYAESRNGAYANAWKTLQEEIMRGGEPLTDLLWIYPRVAKWPDPLIGNRLAQEYLPQLLAAREYSEALRILRDRLAASPDFHARTSADMFRLATFARDVGDRPTARALLSNYARFYPEAPERKAVDELTRELAR